METVTIRVSDAEPGMVTAEDIHSNSMMLLVAQNTSLTERKIARLKLYGIMEFKVYQEEQKQEQDTENLGIVAKKPQNIIQSFKAFRQAFQESTEQLKDIFENVVNSNEQIDSEELLSSVDHVLKESNNGTNVVNMVYYMKSMDNETYMHSINVALICNVFGRWLDLDPEEIDVLTLAGLLHDIGKTKIPEEILRSHDELSAADLVTLKNHTLYGYEILKEKNIDPRIKNVALMHHERNNGSGYPLGLLGKKIDPLAKMVAIVNTFVGMTTMRYGKSGLCPFDVIDLLETEGLHQFDTAYLFTFLERIAQSYIGENVRLSNGMTGEIIMLNSRALSKPIVKVDDTFIDLLKTTNVRVEEII